MMIIPNKNLGQHWLKDQAILSQIVDAADVNKDDIVLEIGPGLGTLTSEILSHGVPVVAVEFDGNLAQNLQKNLARNLTVIHADFLRFDLGALPKSYKIIANIPYNITSPIIEKIVTAKNPPEIAVLLMQKEVAERVVATPGHLSVLAIRTQIFAEAELSIEVPPEKFTPPPEVDSQVLILRPRLTNLIAEFCKQVNVDDQTAFTKTFWRVVQAGFSAKRKKLRSSLSGGLAMSKQDIEKVLTGVSVDPNLRAQDLSINQWLTIALVL
jgi:16S rRNA (adenine1518-N6/adenine1519-N6)-dimethyltransferase